MDIIQLSPLSPSRSCTSCGLQEPGGGQSCGRWCELLSGADPRVTCHVSSWGACQHSQLNAESWCPEDTSLAPGTMRWRGDIWPPAATSWPPPGHQHHRSIWGEAKQWLWACTPHCNSAVDGILVSPVSGHFLIQLQSASLPRYLWRHRGCECWAGGFILNSTLSTVNIKLDCPK